MKLITAIFIFQALLRGFGRYRSLAPFSKPGEGHPPQTPPGTAQV
jgi:hypothetical protein